MGQSPGKSDALAAPAVNLLKSGPSFAAGAEADGAAPPAMPPIGSRISTGMSLPIPR